MAEGEVTPFLRSCPTVALIPIHAVNGRLAITSLPTIQNSPLPTCRPEQSLDLGHLCCWLCYYNVSQTAGKRLRGRRTTTPTSVVIEGEFA